jgi:epoxyqueuosine reductase QueG
MFDLYRFEETNFIIKTCRATDLDVIDVQCAVKKYKAGQKCKNLLKNSKTVIVIGYVITKDMDVVKKGILADDFLCYKASREKANDISAELKKNGFNALVTVGISIKNACVLSGIGVYGKNALIINPEYGTMLRYCSVLTDWEPYEYNKPLNNFQPCENCDECIKACKANCLSPYVVDGLKCMCTYIEKGMKLLQTYPMCSDCQDVCKYNK